MATSGARQASAASDFVLADLLSYMEIHVSMSKSPDSASIINYCSLLLNPAWKYPRASSGLASIASVQ